MFHIEIGPGTMSPLRLRPIFPPLLLPLCLYRDSGMLWPSCSHVLGVFTGILFALPKIFFGHILFMSIAVLLVWAYFVYVLRYMSPGNWVHVWVCSGYALVMLWVFSWSISGYLTHT